MKSSLLNKSLLALLSGIIAVLIVSEFLNAQAIMYPENPGTLNSFFIGLFILSFFAGLIIRFRRKPIIRSVSIGVLLTSASALFMGLGYSFNSKTDEFLLYFLATLLASIVSIAGFGANLRLLITKDTVTIDSISRFRKITFLGFGIGLLLIALPVLATAYLWIGVILLILFSIYLLQPTRFATNKRSLIMAAQKTQPNKQSVEAFIDAVEPEWKRDDAREILKLMQNITGEDPVMWGDTMIGFGNYHYKYASGRKGDWFLAGFSPRKQSMTIYMMGGYKGQDKLLEKLGKYTKSVGCLYIKKLEDVDIKVLEEMTKISIESLKERYAEYN